MILHFYPSSPQEIMTQFNDKELLKLTKLARISCTKEEQASLLEKLTRILSYIEQLNELDTAETQPCNHILPTVHSVLRDDLITECLSREEFLQNSPSHVGGMIRVPPVLNKENP